MPRAAPRRSCNGESYFYVGTVAGQAMGALLDGTWTQPYINSTNPDGLVVPAGRANAAGASVWARVFGGARGV